MPSEGKAYDGYLRIPTSELSSVQLRHLVSEKDPTIAVAGDPSAGGATTTGITEWVGVWRDRAVTVGWDWGVIEGSVVLLNASEIRTNIQLIGRDGTPESPSATRAHLLKWLESQPWRETAIYDLLDREGEDDR